MAEKNVERQRKEKESGERFIGSATFYIYVNFLLGAWGDRMWHFSVGLYLVTLSKGHLRLAAIFGLASGLGVLLLGGIIGNWIDRNGRLKVIRISLFMQNFSVMLSAVAIGFTLYFEQLIDLYWDGGLKLCCEGAILTFGVIAELSSMAYKIAIEKDWIVVVSGGRKSKLANLNAVIRAMDLTCTVLSPIVAGFTMKFASLVLSAVILAAWNLISVFFEYSILLKVYKMVPELANKKKDSKFGKESQEESPNIKEVELEEMMHLTNGNLENRFQKEAPDKDSSESAQLELSPLAVKDEKEDIIVKSANKESNGFVESNGPNSSKQEASTSALRSLLAPFLTMGRSWKVYSSQKVVFAGLSLSSLFMTVLGLDSITVGYIYTNGINEAIVGVSMALAGAAGVLGTFLFTRIRSCIGLERTGLVAFASETLCQVLCVFSIFTPGSPFDPLYKHSHQPLCPDAVSVQYSGNRVTSDLNETVALLNDNIKDNPGQHIIKRDLRTKNELEIAGFNEESFSLSNLQFVLSDSSFLQHSHYSIESSSHSIYRRNAESFLNNSNSLEPNENEAKQIQNETLLERKDDAASNTTENCRVKWKYEGLNISAIILLIGIITSRAGLWMADLTITQTLQENVPENQRGIVGGVQSSLNKLMDFIKFGLVIFLPHVQTFGYLIMLSFLFFCISCVLFTYHTFRMKRRASPNRQPEVKHETDDDREDMKPNGVEA